MSLLKEDLLAELGKLKKKIMKYEKDGRKLNEQSTRQFLIAPLLNKLGWVDDNMEPEYPLPYSGLRNEAVDYALFRNSDDKHPALLIEAKKLDKNLNEAKTIKQLCSYMGAVGAQWGVLTDGNYYMFYNANTGKSFIEQKFLELQIKTADTDIGLPSTELADKLIEFFSFSSLANNTIQKSYEEHITNELIKKELQSLLMQPFDTLVATLKKSLDKKGITLDGKKFNKRYILAYLDTIKNKDGQIPLAIDSNVHSTIIDNSNIPTRITRQPKSRTQTNNSNVKRNTAHKAQQRVTIADLLAAQLIAVGDRWYFYYKKQTFKGKITRNGEIEVNGKRYGSPSAAGKEVTNWPSFWGWNHWQYIDERGEHQKTNKLREQYRRMRKL